MREAFGRWRPWLERGSWIVLVGGVAGSLLEAWWLAWTLVDLPPGFQGPPPTAFLGNLAHLMGELSKAVFFFLVLRTLIFLVPLVMDMRDWMVAPDQEGTPAL